MIIGKAQYTDHAHLLFMPAYNLKVLGDMPFSYSSVGDTGLVYGPVLIYLLYLFLLVWDSVSMLFVFSAFLWSVAVYFVYRLGKDIFNNAAGLLAAAMAAFHPLAIYATTDNSNGVFTASFAAIFFYSLFRIKYKEDSRYWIMMFFSLAFLLQIHASAFVSIALIFIVRPKISLKHFSIAALLLLILFLPLLAYVRTNAMESTVTNGFINYTLENWGFNIKSITNIDSKIFTFDPLYTVLFAVGFIFLAVANLHKPRPEITALILLFAMSSVWLALFPYIEYYSVIFLFILSAIITAVAIDTLVKSARIPITAPLAAMLLLVWAIFGLGRASAYLDDEAHSRGPSISAEKKIAEAIYAYSINSASRNPGGTVIYYQDPSWGVLTMHLLERKGWNHTDSFIYLVIPDHNMEQIPLEHMGQSVKPGDMHILGFRNEITTCRVSTVKETGWESREYDDSGWDIVKVPLNTGSLTNESCISRPGYIPEADLYLRCPFGDYNMLGDYCLLLLFTPNPLYIKDVFLEGTNMVPDKGDAASPLYSPLVICKERMAKGLAAIDLKEDLRFNNQRILPIVIRKNET